MNWTDDEIDKLVQDSANAQHVEYKDAYWAEMETMLDQKPSKKGGIWWWMTACAVLIAGGLGAFAFMQSTNDEVNLIAVKEYEDLGNSKDLNDSKDLIDSKDSKDLMDSKDSKDLIDSKDSKDLMDSKDSKDSKDLIDSKDLMDSKDSKDSKVLIDSKAYGNSSNKNTSFLKTNGSSDGFVAMSSERTSIQKVTTNEADLKGAQQIVNQGIEQSSQNELNSLSLIGSTGGDANQEQITTEKANSIVLGDLALFDWYTPSNNTFELTQEEFKVFPRTRLGFYAAVHGGVGTSYLVTETNNDMYQLGVDAGIEYFRGRWSFGAGLGLRQQYLRNLELIDRRSYYSFGIVNVSSKLNYDQLLFTDLRLNVSYSFGRSAIGIDVTPTFLLGARLSYNQVTTEVKGDHSNIIANESMEHKYVSSKNFNQFGFNTGVNYSYALPKNYLIQLGLTTRIGNPVLNSSFNGRSNKLPLMLELGIKKRF